VDLSGCNAIIILPGLGNCAADYDELKAGLMDRGARRVEVLPIARLDWFRNVAGFADPAYWRGELEPRPILNWYVDRVEKLVDEMGEDVTIIGHSAGGWLARVYLGDELEANRTRVKRLVTLGTPHLPADPDSNAPDQTRGLLNYINKEYPGSFHREVEYVSVAGKHRKGAFFWDDPDKEPECGGTRFEKFFVGAGYWTVCGTLEVWGDSIVPVQSALLPDSQEVILQGVYHSPLGDDDRAAAWYGSPDNIDKWAEALV
jgi:pimeloyl-ACP methyl ester carboxylesterase